MSNQSIHDEHNTKPRRRVVMTLKVGADDYASLACELEQIARKVRMGYLRGEAVSGGYASGYTLKTTEDPTITHESYMLEISP